MQKSYFEQSRRRMLPMANSYLGRLTHGPPHRVLNLTSSNIHAGCEVLCSRAAQIRPKLYVFAHIHEARGAVVRYWDEEETIRRPENVTPMDAVENGEVTERPKGDGIGGEGREARPFTVFVNAAVHHTLRHQHTLPSLSFCPD
ncbi:hypothetical protein FRC20_003586 [Serendipita sp. 405]|nr:hypothetical protein FRC20_003586 [Serendipita sp. 405]